MQVQFVARENGPERLVTEAEVHFEEGPLSGAKLVGFSLWKSPDGEVYVTFPSRAFGAGSERRYFDYLRAIDGSGETIKSVKAWILDEYRNMVALGNSRVEQLKANGLAEAVLYDPPGVGGTGVVTVLAHGNHPEWYGLPADPHVPLTVRVWKSVLRPLGIFAIFGSVIGAFAHFMAEGPKEVKEDGGEGPKSP